MNRCGGPLPLISPPFWIGCSNMFVIYVGCATFRSPTVIFGLQCSPSHIPGCLCRRYMSYFDNYLHDQLQHYSLPPPQLQYLLISLTAGSNFLGCREFWNDIDSFNEPFTNMIWSIDYSRIRLVKTMNDKYQKYRSVLTQFFMDPDRSGVYHLDKSKHMDVAVKTLQYLCR